MATLAQAAMVNKEVVVAYDNEHEMKTKAHSFDIPEGSLSHWRVADLADLLRDRAAEDGTLSLGDVKAVLRKMERKAALRPDLGPGALKRAFATLGPDAGGRVPWRQVRDGLAYGIADDYGGGELLAPLVWAPVPPEEAASRASEHFEKSSGRVATHLRAAPPDGDEEDAAEAPVPGPGTKWADMDADALAQLRTELAVDDAVAAVRFARTAVDATPPAVLLVPQSKAWPRPVHYQRHKVGVRGDRVRYPNMALEMMAAADREIG